MGVAHCNKLLAGNDTIEKIQSPIKAGSVISYLQKRQAYKLFFFLNLRHYDVKSWTPPLSVMAKVADSHTWT